MRRAAAAGAAALLGSTLFGCDEQYKRSCKWSGEVEIVGCDRAAWCTESFFHTRGFAGAVSNPWEGL